MARPDKYEKYVEPYLNKIEQMALTMTEAQIAETLGISIASWKRYKAKHEPLRTVLKKGRKDLVIELKSTLIQKAKGYEYTEKKVVSQHVKWPDELYLLLRDAGFSDEQIEQSQLIRTEVMTKHASPDVAALNLLLKNYDKDWRNDPAEYELKKRAIELQEKKLEDNNW